MRRLMFLLITTLIIFSSCKLKDDPSTSIVEPTPTEVAITVVTPNGGESLPEGSSYQIQWTGTGTTLVRIQYSFDNGTSWGLVVDSLRNTGVYNWFPVPNTISNLCVIRISSIDGITSDKSDKNFAIVKNSNESLKINSPNGGESWEAGSAKQIKWFSSGLDSIKIEYTTDNGQSWNLIGIDKKNTGIYYWEPVPNTPSTLAKIRIMDAKDGNPAAESANTFEILPEPIIKVLTPNGGEKILAGTNRKIEYITENIQNVKIEYTANNGFDWISITETTPATGFYVWGPVPNLNSQLCKVRVSDAIDHQPWDLSDSVFTITNQVTQTVEITSPNGAEKWQAGTAQNITWNSSGIPKVKLEFTSNNGLTWNTISNDLSNTGAYEWNVPNSLSTQCLIKISDASDGDPIDQSNAIFKIVPKPELKVLKPNGGETWTGGIADTLKWYSVGVENVMIEYSSNNGIKWNSIVDKTPSSGSFITSFSSPGSSYKIRIKEADTGSPQDESDGTFTVTPEPSITVTAPNGNEEWYVGSSDNIRWTSAYVGFVKIEYTTNNGFSWTTIIPSTPSTGVYSWNPVQNINSLQCRIRISEAVRGIPSDISDNNFSIVNLGTQLITVTSPNGGEKLIAGSSQKITWDAAGITNVKIEYTLNNGISWNTIVGSTPSTGFYTWSQIPNTLSTNCKIRISDAQDGFPTDDSNQFFSIVPAPDIKVVSPNGGETVQSGTNYEIRWTSENVENVKIEYTINGGAVWNSIINTTPSIGTYIWVNVPNANSLQCKIRVSDAQNGTPFDLSDQNFQITNLIVRSIKLISPNGGEDWEAGTNQNITWDASNIQKVKVELTTDKGANWTLLVDNYSGGAYEWSITGALNSKQCQIRVSAYDDNAISDISDATFTISPKKFVTVTGPKTAVYKSNEPVTISWIAGGIQSVGIKYTTTNGVADLSNPAFIDLAVVGAATGSYTAYFPKPSDKYFVVVYNADEESKGLPSNNSPSFTIEAALIPAVTILAPNGGEQWLVSKEGVPDTSIQNYHPFEIKWHAENTNKVKIEWTTNGGGKWYVVPHADSTENDGILVWAPGNEKSNPSDDTGVPARPDSSDNCRMRISSIDKGGIQISDMTDGFFSIHESPKIRINYPNNGEDFYPPDSSPPKADIHWPMLVSWTSYAVERVKLYYSLDNGVSWTRLDNGGDAGIQSTGAFPWDFIFGPPIEVRTSTLGRIKIVDASNDKIWDVNNVPFWLNVKKLSGNVVPNAPAIKKVIKK